MRWLLVCLLLRADGQVTETKVDVSSKQECQQIGQAWQATANHSDGGTAVFRCELK